MPKGKNIRLSVTSTITQETLVSSSYVWIVQPSVDDLDEWPDHTHISFGSGILPITYNVTVIGSFVYQSSDKSVTQSLLTARTSIRVNLPPPLPLPLPDGKYQLSAFAYNLAGKMPSDQRRALANSLSGIAKQAREVVYPNKITLIQATKDSNSKALGKDLEIWKPILDSFAVKMNSMKSILTTSSDIAAAYEELSTGLLFNVL